jgi:hypothetical protein
VLRHAKRNRKGSVSHFLCTSMAVQEDCKYKLRTCNYKLSTSKHCTVATKTTVASKLGTHQKYLVLGILTQYIFDILGHHLGSTPETKMDWPLCVLPNRILHVWVTVSCTSLCNPRWCQNRQGHGEYSRTFFIDNPATLQLPLHPPFKPNPPSPCCSFSQSAMRRHLPE